MNVILLIAIIFYCTIALIFNVAMISFWREEKEMTSSPWSGSDKADLIGMFFASALWPILLLIGLYKMYFKKEEK